MALLLVYRLLSVTPDRVTYAFGSSPTELTSELVVDPRDPDREPSGTGDLSSLRTVAGRVSLRRLREGSWPEGGAIQA